ncbi:hypothetical protein HD806DRAFT_531135 [Xylariaceae sp. AK1471]|nr:hypothetical protein HD806DRAFT_531135 [Xylariaceae sp. AK1471]
MWPASGLDVHEQWPVSRPVVEAIFAERGVHTQDPQVRNINFPREEIWFGQMCIRQEDVGEQMQSIAMMGIIYESCRRLLIVLEDVVFNPDELQVVQRYDALPINHHSS